MPKHALQFISPKTLLDGWDVSRSFLWRLEKAGLIKPSYLYSKKLYALEDVERLEKMIASGELKVALRGAARRQKSDAGQ